MDQALEQLWQDVLTNLQSQLSRPTYETWIKPTQAQSLNDDTLVISTPNPFARNWLQKHYVSTIATVVQEMLGAAHHRAGGRRYGRSGSRACPPVSTKI